MGPRAGARLRARSRVDTLPFTDRTREHLARQPFGQVPFLTDGELSIFESGAILLHLGERSILMADVLRLVDRFEGLAKHEACRAYQLAHFAAATSR